MKFVFRNKTVEFTPEQVREFISGRFEKPETLSSIDLSQPGQLDAAITLVLAEDCWSPNELTRLYFTEDTKLRTYFVD